jgi:PAS domain S-box-containing protein
MFVFFFPVSFTISIYQEIPSITSSKYENKTTMDLRRNIVNEELRAREERYRRLFETARDGILLIDANTGKTIDANQSICELIEYRIEELVGKHLWDIGLFRDIIKNKEEFIKLQQQELKSGFVRYNNIILESKSGKKIPVEIMSNTYEVRDCRIIQCNLRDITDITKYQKQLEVLDKSKNDFICFVSHELRTPLTGIIGTCSLLKDIAKDADQQELLLMMEKSIDRLKEFIEAAHIMISLSTKSIELLEKEANFEDIFESSIYNHQEKIEMKNLEIQTTLKDDHIKMMINEDLIEKCLFIVLGNAIKYSPNEGTITIVGSCRDNIYQIIIEDEGNGFFKEILDKPFAPYPCQDIDHHYKGTGLDLSIASLIMVLHEGEILIENRNEGGARVILMMNLTDSCRIDCEE